ncbi:MAG: PilZ domain-containing protein [Planctomycetota bacterium]|nr:PilZ domain-containing protein [Planctomycetota bacterium]
MQEKRFCPRYEVEGECDVKILYTGSDPKNMQVRILKAQIKNASVGGLYLEMKEPLREGDLTDCKFQVGPVENSSSLGLVKWNDAGKGMGIEFFYGSEEERDRLQRNVRGMLDQP